MRMSARVLSMSCRVCACALCVLLQAGATPAQQGQQSASVEGRVVSKPSGQPLAYAHVKLVGPEKAQIASVDADSAGHFVFENLSAGGYEISARKPGYTATTTDSCEAEQSSNQSSSQSPSQSGQPLSQSPSQATLVPPGGGKFSIADGQKISDVQLELLAPGVISGTVYDQHGEPLQRANVEAVQSAAFNGRRTLSNGESALTDDRGQYRVFGLTPGKYYVRVTAVFSDYRRRAEDDPEEFVPIYYPDTTDSQAASMIAVRAGEESTGLDFTVKPTGNVKVKGRIVNGLTGEIFNEAGTMVELLDPGDPDKRGHSLYGFPSGGTFTGNGWVPGMYVFSARSFKPITRSGADGKKWTSTAQVRKRW